MTIYKFSRVVAIPFGLAVLYFLFVAFNDSTSSVLVWIIVPVAILILIYLFQPQIDYWWLVRNPIPLDPKLEKLISKINPQYRAMNEEDKQRFENRMLLFVEAKAFIGKGEDDKDVPYDIKYMIAQAAVSLTWNLKTFLINPFERIILYKHPFPSPRFQFLHAYETEVEDGVIIMALDFMEKGLFEPDHFYPLLNHCLAEAFIKAHPAINFPNGGQDFWERYTRMTGFEKEKVLTTLGFKQMDQSILLLTAYLTYPERTLAHFPEERQQLQNLLRA
ncbi:MAG: hypothetical protein HKN09_08315 [Saprospiraceae bacterium]|nr:hypothetical protein [Saprospiraceae bacterium]